MINDPYQVLKRPVVTEKFASAQEEDNTYAFEVDRRANKVEIRKAVEQIFQVKVKKVRTLVRKGQDRRFRFRKYAQADVKFAFVRLAEGEVIEALSA